jgi:hypothetical protein
MLNELIDDAIADGAVGPDEISEKVLPNINDDQRDELIVWAVREAARHRLARHRLADIRQRTSVAPAPAQGESKYARARPHVANPKVWQVWVPQWKRLGDCTAAEVEFIADQYRERAARNSTFADRYDRLRGEMAKAGAVTVGDLDDGLVEDVMRS